MYNMHLEISRSAADSSVVFMQARYGTVMQNTTNRNTADTDSHISRHYNNDS